MFAVFVYLWHGKVFLFHRVKKKIFSLWLLGLQSWLGSSPQPLDCMCNIINFLQDYCYCFITFEALNLPEFTSVRGGWSLPFFLHLSMIPSFLLEAERAVRWLSVETAPDLHQHLPLYPSRSVLPHQGWPVDRVVRARASIWRGKSPYCCPYFSHFPHDLGIIYSSIWTLRSYSHALL